MTYLNVGQLIQLDHYLGRLLALHEERTGAGRGWLMDARERHAAEGREACLEAGIDEEQLEVIEVQLG